MLLSSSSGGGLISRQASTGHLAEEKKLKKLVEKKSARSKRCKSLLMLSSPFSNSATSSVKLSLWSLLHPNQGHKQQQQSPELDQVAATRKFKQRLSSSSTIATAAAANTDDQNKDRVRDRNGGQMSQCQTPRGSQSFGSQTHSSHPLVVSNEEAATNNGAIANDATTATITATVKTQPIRPAKCVKMKLFEQPLDKLFSPKAMKQLNSAINSSNSSPSSSTSFASALGKRKRSSSQTSSSTTNACLRKLFSNADPNNNNNNNSTLTSQNQVRQLLLSVLPEPIRNLLIELYLRGPSTVGIFRKSPNAKHCKELRQKLESDSLSSIQQFQVTVIASVFKEWLRSLPDCLLMSRLYHQWIDVAKLIEPLYQRRSPSQHHQSQSLDDSLYSSNGDGDGDGGGGSGSGSDNTMMQMIMMRSISNTTPAGAATSLRPSRSPLTDNGQLNLQPLDRARSCSTMLQMSSSTSEYSINKMRCDSTGSTSWTSSTTAGSPIAATTTAAAAANDTTAASETTSATSMSAFALSERHSECLRIVRQLLDALNESNLILLRSFICILWHIAQNSDHNKMSANNLGVCVGQSLLNDEHQPSGGKSGGSVSTFSKRHRRARSQCLLSSTLSLTNSTSALQNAYLDTSGAQETAKYVPILIAFIIENAPELFGQDIADIFGLVDSESDSSHHKLDTKSTSLDLSYSSHCEGISTTSISVSDDGQNQLPGRTLDQVDAGIAHHRVDCTNSSLSSHADKKVMTDDGGNGIEIRDHRKLSKQQVDACADDVSNRRGLNSERRQIVVESNVLQSSDQQMQRQLESCIISNRVRDIDDGISNAHHSAKPSDNIEDSSSTTTSILIENSTIQVRSHDNNNQRQNIEQQQLRPLSATESTSSSRASSSTSGVHSESSNASASSNSSSDFVHNARNGSSGGDAISSPSPSPSTVSSPSASSASCSPTQEEQQKHILPPPMTSRETSLKQHDNSAPSGQQRMSLTSEPERPEAVQHQQHQHHQLQQQQAVAQNFVIVPSQREYRNNNHMLNRYNTFTGILNRVPKIPVQFTTSNYGGEAVIYNPRPQHLGSTDHIYTSIASAGDNPTSVAPSKEPVISTKPSSPSANQSLTASACSGPSPQVVHKQQQALPKSHHELKLERLNEFLAHQNQSHHNNQHLPKQQSMAYLPLSSYVSVNPAPVSASRIQQQQQQHQKQSMKVYPLASEYQGLNPINGYQQQQAQHPIFYSTASLSSMQQLQQRDHYLLYHRATLNPQRSHVMSLRDYYLSLQLQNQQRQQQQQITYRNRLHPHSQQQRVPDTINKFHSSSQQQQQQQQQQHQRQYIVKYQQPIRTLQSNVNNLGAQPTANHTIQTRPQTRLAKIRQNQFNRIYVNDAKVSDCSVIVPKQVSNTNVAQKVVVKPMSSSSSDHSSDESDESMNEAWMESTMV